MMLRYFIVLFPLIVFIFTSCSDSNFQVPQNANQIQPLLVGDSIPDITVSDIHGDKVNLAAESTRPTLFVFYRGGWCPFCSAELAEIAKIEEEIYRLGIQIVAISPDRPEFLRQTSNELGIDYTLLSDSPMDAAKSFGVAFRLDTETIEQYRQNGWDLEERTGYDHYLLPVPAVFLANEMGKIEFQYVTPDYKTRLDHTVLLAAARAMADSS
ncbi:MAG: peroxiredoxin-like family protein [Balneolaceae bacterium]